MLQHVQELPLGYTIAVHDDAVRLEPARALVEHYQQLLHHAAHFMYYLLSETWRRYNYTHGDTSITRGDSKCSLPSIWLGTLRHSGGRRIKIFPRIFLQFAGQYQVLR